MRFTEKLARWMMGRNGNDSLNRFLTVTVLILMVVDLFVGGLFITLLGLILLLICTFRMLSRNIPKRSKENMRYLKIKNVFMGKFKLIKNKFKDRKTHVYKKCPKCKAVLRLPKKKGKHTVVCPKCRERFDVTV